MAFDRQAARREVERVERKAYLFLASVVVFLAAGAGLAYWMLRG